MPMDVQHFKKDFLTIRISSSENSFQRIDPLTDSKPLSTAPHLLKTLISCSKHKFKFFFLYVFIRHKEAVNLFRHYQLFFYLNIYGIFVYLITSDYIAQ